MDFNITGQILSQQCAQHYARGYAHQSHMRQDSHWKPAYSRRTYWAKVNSQFAIAEGASKKFGDFYITSLKKSLTRLKLSKTRTKTKRAKNAQWKTAHFRRASWAKGSPFFASADGTSESFWDCYIISLKNVAKHSQNYAKHTQKSQSLKRAVLKTRHVT